MRINPSNNANPLHKAPAPQTAQLGKVEPTQQLSSYDLLSLTAAAGPYRNLQDLATGVQGWKFQNPADPYRPFGPVWGPALNMADGPHEVDLLVEPYNQMAAIDPESGKRAPQGSCGTTSLAMIMNHHRPGSARQEDIDQAIRRSNKLSFTNPADIVDYANRHGFRSELKNNATIDDLVAMVDRGVPVQVAVDPIRVDKGNGPKTDDAGLHYVVVNGYKRDPGTGEISHMVVSDPWGLHYQMDLETFNAHWGNLKINNVSTGMNNLMIVTVPQKGTIQDPKGKAVDARSIPLPARPGPGDSIWLTTGVAGAWMDMRNAWVNPRPESVGLFASGLVKAAGALPALLFHLPGTISASLGGPNHIPVLSELGGLCVQAAEAIAQPVEIVTNTFTGMVVDAGNAVATMAKGAWSAISSL